MNHREFSPKFIEKLGYYVYLYIDPRDSTIFYVGKGQGNRAFSHLSDASESRNHSDHRAATVTAELVNPVNLAFAVWAAHTEPSCVCTEVARQAEPLDSPVSIGRSITCRMASAR